MEILDNPEWQQAECPVGNNVETRYGKDKPHQHGGVQTFSIRRFKRPESADWSALEGKDKEQDRTKENSECHCEANGPDVEFGGRYSEQEEANADLEKRSRKYIENLAKEPVLGFMLVTIGHLHRVTGHTWSAISARAGSRSSMCRPVP